MSRSSVQVRLSANKFEKEDVDKNFSANRIEIHPNNRMEECQSG